MIRIFLTPIIFFLISTAAFAEMQRGIQSHIRGDVIAVQTDPQIAAWCDFNKQIVVTQFNVLCVYNGNKEIRNNGSL